MPGIEPAIAVSDATHPNLIPPRQRPCAAQQPCGLCLCGEGCAGGAPPRKALVSGLVEGILEFEQGAGEDIVIGFEQTELLNQAADLGAAFIEQFGLFAFEALLFFLDCLKACSVIRRIFHAFDLVRISTEKKKSRPQISEGGAHECTAVALDQITVADDDAVEIPAQDGFDRDAGGVMVGNHASYQPMRTQMSGRAGQPIEHARLRGTFPRQVEDEVGKYQCARSKMEKDHLIEERCAAKQVLLDLTRPSVRGLITESDVEL